MERAFHTVVTGCTVLWRHLTAVLQPGGLSAAHSPAVCSLAPKAQGYNRQGGRGLQGGKRTRGDLKK